jgi:hypothetical protein
MSRRLGMVLLGLVLFGGPALTLVLPARGEHQAAYGYGRCSKCYCRRFEGNASTCQNSGCGHSYYDHY